MKVRELERSGCLRLLLLLKDGDVLSAREVGKSINYPTFQKGRDILVELGLMEVTDSDGQKILHKLTDLGLNIALRVGEIEELLE